MPSSPTWRMKSFPWPGELRNSEPPAQLERAEEARLEREDSPHDEKPSDDPRALEDQEDSRNSDELEDPDNPDNPDDQEDSGEKEENASSAQRVRWRAVRVGGLAEFSELPGLIGREAKEARSSEAPPLLSNSSM